MTNPPAPFEVLLARAGGIRGLIYTGIPVTVFAAVSAAFGLVPAVVAALGVAAVIFGWQLWQRESIRPALFGLIGVVACGGYAFFTGRAKDFYLPGIWMYLALAIVFTISVLVRWPLVGVGWAWITGRDQQWRRVPRVRRAFDLVTIVMAAVSWLRFFVQYYLYDTDQEGLLAAARIAMGWPIFLVTSTLIYLAVRTAIRAMPRTRHEGDEPLSV